MIKEWSRNHNKYVAFVSQIDHIYSYSVLVTKFFGVRNFELPFNGQPRNKNAKSKTRTHDYLWSWKISYFFIIMHRIMNKRKREKKTWIEKLLSSVNGIHGVFPKAILIRNHFFAMLLLYCGVASVVVDHSHMVMWPHIRGYVINIVQSAGVGLCIVCHVKGEREGA